MACSCRGTRTSRVCSPHCACICASAVSRRVRHFMAVKTDSSAPTKAGDIDRSMSSEKRSITPYSFDSDVPPLNTRCGAVAGSAKSSPRQPADPEVLLDHHARHCHARCSLRERERQSRVEALRIAMRASPSTRYLSVAKARRAGCIHPGAKVKSSNSVRRSATGTLRLSFASRCGVTCSSPRLRRA